MPENNSGGLMVRNTRTRLAMLLILVVVALAGFGEETSRDVAIRSLGELELDLAQLEKSHAAYQVAASNLASAAVKLNAQVDETIAAAKRTDSAAGSDRAAALQRLEEMSQAFNIQYLALLQQMQGENRQYTALTAAMRAKHNVAKEALSNLN